MTKADNISLSEKKPDYKNELNDTVETSGAKSLPAIILDTDMGNDIDDALALAMLHALEDDAECRLLGVSVCKDNSWAAGYTQLVNARCGRSDLPVGLVRGGVTPGDGNFVRQASEAAGVEGPPDRAEDAVRLLRRLLVGEKDGSVTLVSIGFFTNLARLLDSPPDQISPLLGRELVALKVCLVTSMAAGFCESSRQPNGHNPGNPEYNIRTDVEASRNFIANCPCPIIFSGWEVGARILFPGAVMESLLKASPEDIVALGYAHFLPMPYDRPSWDMTAVLQAVRPEAGYFDLSAPGCVSIDPTGCATFFKDAAGPHRFLILHEEKVCQVREAIVDLCTRPCKSPVFSL